MSAPPGPSTLRETLLALEARDLARREELAEQGVLHEGYHPRMEAVHRENARELRALIERFGWPNEQRAGADGAQAAWLIAQHAIAEPEFMRSCRSLLEREVAAGTVPFWQLAYLDDRICVSEGRLQRFGTQIELTPEGPTPCPVQAPETLDARRAEAGLRPIAEQLKRMANDPRPTPEQFAQRKAQERAWRAQVGWTPHDGN